MHRHLTLRRLAITALALTLTFTVGACARQSSEPDGATVDRTDTAEPTGTPPADGYVEGVRVYFIRDEKLGASAHYRTSESDESPQELAVIELLVGPDAKEQSYGFTTAIPGGTTLLGLKIGSDGINTVDLSGTFDDGGGGTLSMSMRLAQVVCALTQFPDCKGVLFKIDGVPVETFSGEGIILDGPLTRDDFEELLPAIFVESPLPGSPIPGENRGVVPVYGTANVFEAVFGVEVRAGDGAVLAEQQIQATSGTGTRGTFDATVPLYLPAEYERTTGSVVFYVASPKDGSPVDVVTIPVYLAPLSP
jgi:hypothetical protein